MAFYYVGGIITEEGNIIMSPGKSSLVKDVLKEELNLEMKDDMQEEAIKVQATEEFSV